MCSTSWLCYHCVWSDLPIGHEEVFWDSLSCLWLPFTSLKYIKIIHTLGQKSYLQEFNKIIKDE